MARWCDPSTGPRYGPSLETTDYLVEGGTNALPTIAAVFRKAGAMVATLRFSKELARLRIAGEVVAACVSCCIKRHA
jgi:hypothetical protein